MFVNVGNVLEPLDLIGAHTLVVIQPACLYMLMHDDIITLLCQVM